MRQNDRRSDNFFSGQINVLAEATTDHEILKRAIRSIRPEGNSRIYDAVSFVIDEKLRRGCPEKPGGLNGWSIRPKNKDARLGFITYFEGCLCLSVSA
ncbi:MAG TPA: hypothetical protein VI306_03470 [Pyrinomonadaceae bacterium]